jgi:hypothetical protein
VNLARHGSGASKTPVHFTPATTIGCEQTNKSSLFTARRYSYVVRTDERSKPMRETMSEIAGKVVWFELPAKDTKRAREFYGQLCGWQFQVFEGTTEYYMTYEGGGAYGPFGNAEEQRSMAVFTSREALRSSHAATRSPVRRRPKATPRKEESTSAQYRPT